MQQDILIMRVNLLSCTSQKPDKRAIAKFIASVATDVSDSFANEITEIILDEDPVEIELDDRNAASSLRDLRKLNIVYEILD